MLKQSNRPQPIRNDPISILFPKQTKGKQTKGKQTKGKQTKESTGKHGGGGSHMNIDHIISLRLSPYFKKKQITEYQPDALKNLTELKSKVSKENQTLINEHLLIRNHN